MVMEEKSSSKGKTLLLVSGIGIVLACLCLCAVMAIVPGLTSTPVAELGTDKTAEPTPGGVQLPEPNQPETPETLDTPTPVPTNTSTPTPRPTSTPVPGLVGVGTHIVGDDIQPGIYRGQAGGDMLSSCYWARLSDLTGDIKAIIANDNEVGQFYVEVLESDYALETSCELILLEYAPAVDVGDTLPPGTYIVGRDIRPGTYRGQAGDDIMESCYWARLRDVSGEMGSIIANDNAVGSFYVQVLESDFALKTSCTLQKVD